MAVVLSRVAETPGDWWALMYLAAWASSDSARSLDDRINADIAERRRAVGGDLGVTAAGRLKTRDGTTIVLRRLVSRGTRSTYDVIAYAQDAPIIFGMTAQTEATLVKTLPQFDRFIESVTIQRESALRIAPPAYPRKKDDWRD